MMTMLPPIHEQIEFEHDSLLQMFDGIGWRFFIAWAAQRRLAVAEALLTADASDVAEVATLQGQARALLAVLDFEAQRRSNQPSEGTNT